MPPSGEKVNYNQVSPSHVDAYNYSPGPTYPDSVDALKGSAPKYVSIVNVTT